jgi:hypothetical protein
MVTKSQEPRGDALYYATQGYAIAHGRGFAAPLYFAGPMPSADHPPLNALVMAIGPLVSRGSSRLFGLEQFLFLQRFTLVVIGTITVVVIGIVARRAVNAAGNGEAAHAAGVLAAFVAAICPSLWINDGILMAESVTALTIAVVLLAALRAWDGERLGDWALLGVSIAISALARAEFIGLLAVLVLPMLVMKYRKAIPTLVVSGAVCGFAALAVCATWLVPNALRFEERALFSTNDGLTWLGANCNQTYYGDWAGTWSLECLRNVDTDHNGLDDFTDLTNQSPYIVRTEDQSQLSARYQAAAFRFIGSHKSDLARVVAIRVARTWGLWKPAQMVEYNRGENRVGSASWMAWGFHLVTLPLAVLGLVVLKRLGRPTWPFLSQAALVTITSAVIYGLARFRIGWDVAACVLVGIAIGRFIRIEAFRAASSSVTA